MKLSKTLLALSMLVGVLAAHISFISPVEAAGNVDILSHSGYIDSFGYYHVVGEVQNVGDQAAKFVKIDAVFYDSNNLEMDRTFDLTALYVILAGRRSPFDIVLSDMAQSAKVDHYELSTTFMAASSIPAELDILSHNSYLHQDGFGIAGEITNAGTEKAKNVKMIATYRDRKGNVVAAALTYLHFPAPEESDIEPGQTVQFEILLSDERTPYAYTYELTAESSQYACMGEYIGKLPSLPTDLNNDGIVNIQDLALVAVSYGSEPGDEKWNQIADIDNNGIINIVDITLIARDYGKTA